ncbi:FtsH protease activity modulator HflK [Andreprevotia chitinilytica]|uniref:FtsH protease activity modulator HflK n=1 Tax=Andreprevotia chitinilytica TaxID=396808 RepID=UPI0005553B09|nr:FtsH protease activity modulator HflK [Andreprevotia chitinilytica]
MTNSSPDDAPSAAMPSDRGGFVSSARDKLLETLQLLGLSGRGLPLLAGLIAIAWVAAGIYKVQPDEQGVVVRFGKWVDTTEPGLHYHLPYPVETVLLPKVTQVNELHLGKPRVADADGSNADLHDKQMLTGDENIVEADCVVFWRIKDAGRYLFQVENPEKVVKVAAESALREIISRTPIQSAMSDKRQQIADQSRELLQRLLDAEQAGIFVTQVQLQRVDPPAAVIDAFNDVQRARADQERARNEAEAYRNDVLPRARGEADRINQEAQAYKSQVVNLAEGEAKSFLAVYQSYAKAKDVTAWRLYLESMDEMLKKATKVVIDSSGKGVSSVVPYMQLNEKDKSAAKAAK